MDHITASRQLVKVDLFIREKGRGYVVPLELLTPCESSDQSIEYAFALLTRLLKEFNRGDAVVRMIIGYPGENVSMFEQAWNISQAIAAAIRNR